MNIALITGVNGQDGSYLSELLLSKGYCVYGMLRRSSTDTTERIEHVMNDPNFNLVDGDVTDATGVHRMVGSLQPTEVYNLAAMSHVRISFDQPVATFEVNAVGVINLLEAIRLMSPKSRLYQASTSELFGNSQGPHNEDSRFDPQSPYAVAKLAAHEAVSLYRNAYGVYACAGILFNHESERRGENFVTRKITQYVAMLLNCYDKTGQVPVKGVDVQPLYLGNLDARRDWSHAEDMVRGMWMMLQQDEPNDYVLGSGKARSVRDFLVAAFDRFGHSWEDYVEIDPKFYRPAEVHLLEANPTKAQTELGWEPKVSFQDLVNRMVDVDYEAIKKCRV